MSKSESIANVLLCNRCGQPTGDIWYLTDNLEIVCIPCWKKGEGRVAS